MCSYSIYKPSLVVAVLLLVLVDCITCRRLFQDQGFYPSYFNERNNYATIQLALDKLDHALKPTPKWPDTELTLGQVSGVALNQEGHLLVFHRGSHVWDASSFNMHNIYQAIEQQAIAERTVLVFNDTGAVVDMWGENFFYMPHGITVDHEGNVWLTDVAMHQVFKFTPKDRLKPALSLGEKFVPGSNDEHFCKPTSVAVMSSGDFFVADGYCNYRIIKYAADGTKILEWGLKADSASSPYAFLIPHALALVPPHDEHGTAGTHDTAATQDTAATHGTAATYGTSTGAVCTADRERGRVSCFRADNGTHINTYSSWLVGARIFSLAYSPVEGGRLYVVNGPGTGVPVRGYVIDYSSGKLLQTFAPDGDFSNPHDIAVSEDGTRVYVAEINPYRVCRFTDETLRNASGKITARLAVMSPGKPIHTVDTPTSMEDATSTGWRGLAGGVAGALGAALCVAGVALVRARTRGRKSVPRRRWEYGQSEFKIRRLLERRRFTRVQSEDSEDEPAPMMPAQPAATA